MSNLFANDPPPKVRVLSYSNIVEKFLRKQPHESVYPFSNGRKFLDSGEDSGAYNTDVSNINGNSFSQFHANLADLSNVSKEGRDSLLVAAAGPVPQGQFYIWTRPHTIKKLVFNIYRETAGDAKIYNSDVVGFGVSEPTPIAQTALSVTDEWIDDVELEFAPQRDRVTIGLEGPAWFDNIRIFYA